MYTAVLEGIICSNVDCFENSGQDQYFSWIFDVWRYVWSNTNIIIIKQSVKIERHNWNAMKSLR